MWSALMEPVEAAYRQEYGQVVASLIKLTGDWELAEDCAQDALASAARALAARRRSGQAGCLVDDASPATRRSTGSAARPWAWPSSRQAVADRSARHADRTRSATTGSS